MIPFPHNEFALKEVKKFDDMSAADRLKQIGHSLTLDEHTAVCGFVLLCSCGTLENTSFYEFLHWWALCNYSYEYCVEYLMKYKFETGQSSFAINFFQEALSTGNLSYSFNQRVTKIEDQKDHVAIQANDRTFEAAKVVCTIPLNVLGNVEFCPPLPSGKQKALAAGHVNKCAKVHAECANPELRSWSGIDYPNNKLTYAFGDGTLPNGNTHIVAFGGDYNHLDPEVDIDETKDALQILVPMSLERVASNISIESSGVANVSRYSIIGLKTNSQKEPGKCETILLDGTNFNQVLLSAGSSIESPGRHARLPWQYSFRKR